MKYLVLFLALFITACGGGGGDSGGFPIMPPPAVQPAQPVEPVTPPDVVEEEPFVFSNKYVIYGDSLVSGTFYTREGALAFQETVNLSLIKFYTEQGKPYVSLDYSELNATMDYSWYRAVDTELKKSEKLNVIVGFGVDQYGVSKEDYAAKLKSFLSNFIEKKDSVVIQVLLLPKQYDNKTAEERNEVTREVITQMQGEGLWIIPIKWDELPMGDYFVTREGYQYPMNQWRQVLIDELTINLF